MRCIIFIKNKTDITVNEREFNNSDKEIYMTTVKETLPKLRDLTEKELFSGITQIFFLYYENEIAGIAAVNNFHLLKAYLVVMLIVQKHRLKGLGSTLLNKIIDSYKNVIEFSLHVSTNNPGAMSFYIKNKFKLVKLIEGYYLNDRIPDSYLMRRSK